MSLVSSLADGPMLPHRSTTGNQHKDAKNISQRRKKERTVKTSANLEICIWNCTSRNEVKGRREGG